MVRPTRYSTSNTRCFPVLLELAITILLAGSQACTPQKEARKPVPGEPRVLDERLALNLFAENPQIVTPIGIAIDSLDRIFVLESHTHLPPKDYPGPKGDVVKVFTDSNGDGKPEKTSVFAQGFQEGLSLAFSPAGHLYLVTSRAVWQLLDGDGNGVSERQVKILGLAEPQKVYAHAALLGIAFSPDGWMYVSRGNTGSAAWRLVGTDSSQVSGYGDGGNIVRARPDGTQLEEVATGFWNPVDLKFDLYGRLLACDNDPDSRGPNRLLHIIPGGDYGYQSRYGGSGIHPYLAWNGELPGTLPYAVGLGEAPSGLLDAGTAALPADYHGQLLSSIWEESRIVRIKLSPRGVSVGGQAAVLVEGGEGFRPVAFATDRKGAIYFTDWVQRDYPNHGKGRIWKLTARPDAEVVKPRPPYARFLPDPAGNALREMNAADDSVPLAGERLLNGLRSGDPFVRQAAVASMARPAHHGLALTATRDSNAAVRLGALLALRQGAYREAEPVLERLLADPDAHVRQTALRWVGQGGFTSLRHRLDRALSAGPVSPALFETYLETVSHLEPNYVKAYQGRAESYAKSIKRPLPPQFIEQFLADPSRSPSLRALAVRHLEHPEKHQSLLSRLLGSEKDTALRLALVRVLAAVPGPSAADQLLQLAAAPSNPAVLRAEALLALAGQPVDASARVAALLEDAHPDVQLEAVRYLRGKAGNATVRQVLQRKYEALQDQRAAPLGEQIALVLADGGGQTASPQRPASLDGWDTALAAGGDAERGRRVFYSTYAACAACHAIDGSGGDLGPDLSNVGRSKSRSQLIRSILRPSAEVSPEYQGWYVKLNDGEVHQGRQIDVGDKQIELYVQGTGFVSFDKNRVAAYGMADRSLMPDGLQNRLSIHDLRDLIAFLEGKDR